MRSVPCCAVCAYLLVCACDEHQYDETKFPDKAPTDRAALPFDAKPPPTPRKVAENLAADMAEARCDREQRCEQVGEGKTYPSRAACLAKVSEDWREQLDLYKCPAGVVPAAFERCKQEIREEDCLNPFDTLERLVDCDSRQVCREAEPY